MRLRFENVDLLGDLAQAKDRQEKVNEEALLNEKKEPRKAPDYAVDGNPEHKETPPARRFGRGRVFSR